MSSASARAQEPSMEEILASIRRIISDDQDVKPEAKAPEPEPARPSKTARVAEPPRPVEPLPPAPPAPVRESRGASPQAEPSATARDEDHDERDHAPAQPVEAERARPAPRAESAASPEPIASPSVAPAPAGMPSRAEPPVAAASPVQADAPAPRTATPAGAAGLDLSLLDVGVPEIMFSDGGGSAAPRPQARTGFEALISQEATASVGDAFNLLSHTILSNNARTLEDLVQDLLKPILKSWLDDNLPSLVERLVRAEIERVARGR